MKTTLYVKRNPGVVLADDFDVDTTLGATDVIEGWIGISHFNCQNNHILATGVRSLHMSSTQFFIGSFDVDPAGCLALTRAVELMGRCSSRTLAKVIFTGASPGYLLIKEASMGGGFCR